MARLLTYMAHPDDAEILAGGILLRLKAVGWEVGIATMTAGDCGSDSLSRQEISRTRLAEAEAAARFLGGRYACTGLNDVEVMFNAENVRRVVEVMRSFAPDVVITHSPVDYMVDHEEASRLVRASAFAVAMPLYQTGSPVPAPPAPSTPALYYADAVEGVDHFGKRIAPEWYVDISDVMDAKRTMLSYHRSQRQWLQSHHGIDEYLNRMASWGEVNGRECGVLYAEGLRQHLGHGYPHEPVLQASLKAYLRKRT